MYYEKIKFYTKKFFLYLWSLFLSGLLTILPLTFTVVFLNYSFKLLVKWLEPIRLIEPNFLKIIPYSEVAITILSIFALGILLKVFVLKHVVHALEELIYKIPLVRPVYKGLKQLTNAFSADKDKVTFTQVIFIEFPRKGIYSLGFLTNALPETISPEQDKKYFNVFVPTTPNPTTGFYLIVEENEIKKTNLNKQEAMAIIMSGGIIMPDRYIKSKEPKNLQT